MFRQSYLALTSAVADAPKAAVDSIAALIAALKAEAEADAVQFPGAAIATDTVAADAAPAAAAAGAAVPAAIGARS
ncbi:hypothetical protein CP973_17395 [Streptomyces albofaciens JCM 4342]|uniref:hypothetical protein n=1 Tax=Streptomyces albofaciens TaxID=66866 RepID=UPI00123A77DC|nr:hypothetical protein [Streptomyces albofaciens]KAA6223463.1 hypothetical protein CP973_17395 [Streptomyces albofaciens JCM 4342]